MYYDRKHDYNILFFHLMLMLPISVMMAIISTIHQLKRVVCERGMGSLTFFTPKDPSSCKRLLSSIDMGPFSDDRV